MLVLSRKENEGIIIGEGIIVRVMGIEDGRVSIGIEAPKEVSIHREEVFEAIRKENMEASGATAGLMDALGELNGLQPWKDRK
ncbi:MAG: carbon storage regulator CsrA [Peptostreptococcaceae bacterium]|nr:carbon storage regulator CsrA [Peptostreptococcaceae bacterium]